MNAVDARIPIRTAIDFHWFNHELTTNGEFRNDFVSLKIITFSSRRAYNTNT